jgi:hypothetical protein
MTIIQSTMKKLVILTLLMLIAGCGTLGLGGGSQVSGTSAQGSQGLQIRFMQNLPPTQIFDTEQMSAQLEVRNVGAYEVGGAGDRIYLSGFDPNIVVGIPPGGIQLPRIEGQSEFNPRGSFDFATFDNIQIRNIPTERFPVIMLATACYGYETKAAAQVCLDPNPNIATLQQKVCNPSLVQVTSQAAPIRVTNIQAEPRRGVTTFRISVQNSGGGSPFRNGVSFLNRCSPFDRQGLSFSDIDYVQVIDVSAGGRPLNCRTTSEDGHVRLANGAGMFTCESTVQGNDAYTTPMSITLRYGYRQQLRTQFNVIQTPR